MPMPYTPAEITTALKSSQRRWSFRYDRVPLNGTDVTPEEVVSCTVRHAELADVKRTCEVTLPSSSTFNQLTDRLRVYARLQMLDTSWQEWALGTFYLQTSARKRATAAGDSMSQRTGYDGSLRLQDDKLPDRHVVAAGYAYTTAIKDQLTAAGLPTTSVVNSAVTLPAPMEWEPGTTRMKVINDLLAAINYRSLSFDPMGAPYVVPYTDPAQAGVIWRYTVDASSLVRPGIETELDLFSMPNRWIGFVSQPELPPLRSVITNTNAADPLSTVGRNRTIAKVIDTGQLAQAPTQDLLDAAVRRAAQEDRSQYESVSFSTGLMPIHGSGDVFELDVDGVLTRYRETEWQMELRAGGNMRHTMRRVVTL